MVLGHGVMRDLGAFDTLQFYEGGVPQSRVPYWKRDSDKERLELFAKAYPGYEGGGAAQLHMDGRKIKFDSIDALPEEWCVSILLLRKKIFLGGAGMTPQWPKLIAYSPEIKKILILEGAGHGLMDGEISLALVSQEKWREVFEELGVEWFFLFWR